MTTEAARAASVRFLERIRAIIKEPADRDILAVFFAALSFKFIYREHSLGQPMHI